MYRRDRCFVAFIDILGFKNLVDTKSTDEIVSIFNEINKSNRQTGIYRNSNSNLIPIIPREELKYRVMSDSVVFFIDASIKDALYPALPRNYTKALV